MRRRDGIFGAALVLATASAGCRGLDDLGGLRFDLAADGGGGTGGGAGGATPGPDAGPDAIDGDVCTPAPPPGWKGPVAFYEGAPGTVPACSGAYPVVVAQGNADLDAPPATCSACACSAPTASCGPSSLTVYGKTNCHGSGAKQVLASGVCTPVSGTSGSDGYFEQSSPKPAVSACTPAGGAPTVPKATWSTAGVVCGRSGGDTPCADAGVCAPQPDAPFEAQWCIYHEGAQACPSGFMTGHVWESMKADGRGCTPCACGGGSGAICSTSTTLYGDTGCTGQVGAIAADKVCDSASNALAAIATITSSGTPSCPASGGTPTGSTTTTPVLTVCCPG